MLEGKEVNHPLFDKLQSLAENRDRKPVDFTAELNPQQREAVITTEGPILILAGAGSGKTRVITYRIAHMVETCGVRPESILAVTFTNKAAGEMKQRIEKLLAGAQLTGFPLISTFHSLCVRILRRDIEKLEQGYSRSFTIYDSDDQQKLLKNCTAECKFDEKQWPIRVTQSAISGAKNRGISPDEFMASSYYSIQKREPMGRLYALYQQKLKAANALDFDDLLVKTVSLLEKSGDARRYYHNRFKHMMVDEFQDTNAIQYALTRLITEGDYASPTNTKSDDFWTGRSLCVVGDESQSIYKFRGSDFKIILGFQKDFPNTKVIKLEQNYRSTKRILEAANEIISKNKERFDKQLFSSAEDGEKIKYAQLWDGEDEARWIVGKIKEHQKREPNIRTAVLYRTNAQSRIFEEACRRGSIHYNLIGGFSFYERAEVKDIIAYLKLALNPHDSVALMRVINTPARGIGKTTIDEVAHLSMEAESSYWDTVKRLTDPDAPATRITSVLKKFRSIMEGLIAKAENPKNEISDVVKAAIADTGYEQSLKETKTEEAEGRLQNLEELVNAAAESEERGDTLRNFLDYAALASDTDSLKADAKVTLMTMHAAKGLEFPLVFIAGLEENLFPHSRAKDDPSDLEEERRLCYVAVTRAEKYLYITHAKRRRVYGDEMPADPSRFLNEFPPHLMDNLSTGSNRLGHGKSSSSSASSQAAGSSSSYSNNKSYGSTYHRSSDTTKSTFKSPPPSSTSSSPGIAKSGTGSGGLQVGIRVKHAKYGVGLIIKREGDGDSTKLTINFPGYGHKKMIEKYASLEKA